MSVNIQKADGLRAIAGLINSAVMTGATEESQGKSGLVPTPLSADRNSFLRGDGKWIDPGFADILSTINNTLEEVKEETRERINYYDNIAEIALGNVDEDLDGILEAVQEHGESKKEEITEATATVIDEISNLSEQEKSEITALAEQEKTEISNLSEQKEEEFNTVSSQKKIEIASVGDKEKEELEDAASEKVSELDEIIADFQAKADEGLNSEHITKSIVTEDGVHGLRYYEDQLQYDNHGTWHRAAGYITYPEITFDASTGHLYAVGGAGVDFSINKKGHLESEVL